MNRLLRGVLWLWLMWWPLSAASYPLALDTLVAPGWVGSVAEAGAGRLTPGDPADEFTFAVSAAVVVWAEDLGAPTCCVDWELQSSDGAGVFSFSDRFNGAHPGRRSLPAGAYRIRVRTGGPIPEGGLDYSFRLRTVVDDAPFDLGLGEAIADGRIGERLVTGAGRLELGQRDIYRFRLEAPTALYLEDMGGANCCGTWEVRGPGGVVRAVDPIDGMDPGRREFAAGEHEIWVHAPSGSPGWTGAYGLRLIEVRDDEPVAYELGEVVSAGRVGAREVSGAGRITRPGERDVYRFRLLEPTRIRMDDLGAERCCLEWQIRLESGAVRLVDRLDGNDPGPLELPAGEHQVWVQPGLGNLEWVGDYSFRLDFAGPSILEQPASVTVLRNSDVVFRIVAVFRGEGSHQWYRDNVLIPGATGSELRLDRVGMTDAGRYHCVVTDERGSSESVKANLVVRQNHGTLVSAGLVEAPDAAAPGNGVRVDFFHGQAAWPDMEGDAATASFGRQRVDFPTTGVAVEPGPGYGWFLESEEGPPPGLAGLRPSRFSLAMPFMVLVTPELDLHPGTPEIDLDMEVGFQGRVRWNVAEAWLGDASGEVMQRRVTALSFPEPGWYPVRLEFASEAGVRAGLELRWRTDAAEGWEVVPQPRLRSEPAGSLPGRAVLSGEPGALSVRVVRGTGVFVPIRWRNAGTRGSEAGEMQLPEIPWVGVVEGRAVPALAPGEHVERTLHLTPPPDEPFGRFEGSVDLRVGDGDASVPLVIEVGDDVVRDRVFRVEDEHTYFTDAGPRVAGALVRLREPWAGEARLEGMTDEDGQLVLPGVPDGVHAVEISAPGHLPYSGFVTLDAGTAEPVRLFLPRETVRLTWSVEPATADSETRLVLETTFETQVPLPVVTVSPAAIGLEGLRFEDGVATMVLVVTNSGLIAAEGVRVAVPTHPLHEVELEPAEVGRVPALGSVPVTVRIRDRSWVWRRFMGRAPGVVLAEGGSAAGLPESAAPWLEALRAFAAGRDAEAARRFPGPAASRGARVAGEEPCAGQPGWQMTSGGCTDGSTCAALWGQYAGWQLDYHQYVADATLVAYEGLYGNAAAGLYRHYLARTVPDRTVFRNGDEVVDGVTGGALTVTGFANSPTTLRAVEAMLAAAMARVAERHDCTNLPVRVAVTNLFLPEELGVFERMLNFDRFDSDIAAFLAGGGKRINGAGGSASLGRCDDRRFDGDVLITTRPTECEGVLELELTYDGELTIVDSIDFCPGNILNRLTVAGTEVNLGQFLGLDSMQILEANCRAQAVPFAAIFKPSAPPMRFYLRCEEDCCPLSVTATHCYRCGGFNICRDVPVPISLGAMLCPPGGPGAAVTDAGAGGGGGGGGGGGSRGAWTRHGTGSAPCRTTAGAASDTGSSRRQARLSTDGEGVCAAVRLRLDQEAVLVRDVFQARLELENNTGSALEDISVELEVRTEQGDTATERFAMAMPIGHGLEEGGGLGPGAQAGFAWTLQPLPAAAPANPEGYWVGGWIRYGTESGLVEMPLAPAFIRVQPVPRIAVRYFHQREVHGDDPFTVEEESAEPFSLGVQVANLGPGMVRGFRLTTGAPVITDNEKGLPVTFALVDSEIDGVPVGSGLTAELGSMTAGTLRTVHWRFVGSVQGVFSGFTTRQESVDALGRVVPPVVESVSLHVLTRAIRVGGPAGGAGPDFLVDADGDDRHLPDQLYLSDGHVEGVQVVEAVLDPSVPMGPMPGAERLETPPVEGWVYRRVMLGERVERRLARIVRADGQELDPAGRAWITRRTFRGPGEASVAELVLHLVDQGGPGSYVLEWASPDSPPLPGADVVMAASLERVRIPVLSVLSNDVDPESGVVRLVGVDAVSEGGAKISVQGEWIVYAGTAGVEVDRFGYEVADGAGQTARGMVELRLSGNGDELHRVHLSMLADGRFGLEYIGIPGRRYRVQRTWDLSVPVWEDQGLEVADRTGRVRWTTPEGVAGAAFYRMVAE